jgi:tRNA nucleotidyltransferase (CCA-adding enzyme)
MKIYMVGGAVRDKLMGIKPKDVNFVVVGSSPEEMVTNGLKQVGADFPVFLDEIGVEYALARTERKTGPGHSGFETNHGKDVTLEEDLARRDLTINAIAEDEDGNIIDPFGGQADIQNKVLRHVSAAFSDDPVRVLRLARFRARFGDWKIEPATSYLCRRMVRNGELNHLTSERVLKEMEKALGEPYPHLFFETLAEIGALQVIMPEII